MSPVGVQHAGVESGSVLRSAPPPLPDAGARRRFRVPGPGPHGIISKSHGDQAQGGLVDILWASCCCWVVTVGCGGGFRFPQAFLRVCRTVGGGGGGIKKWGSLLWYEDDPGANADDAGQVGRGRRACLIRRSWPVFDNAVFCTYVKG